LALAPRRWVGSNAEVLTRRRLLALAALSAASCRAQRTRCETADADVLVIGAGLAGLAAAHALLAAGRSVVVLEARARVGGRVHTLREPFAHGQFAEAGAIFVPADHALTRGYLREFGLELVDAFKHSSASALFVRGRLVHAGDAELPVELREDERAAGLRGLFLRYVLPGLAEAGELHDTDTRSERLARLDPQSFAEFLRARGASSGALELMQLGFLGLHGDGFESVSALQVLRELGGSGPGGTQRVAGGSDRLPEAMAEPIQERIRHGAEVLALQPLGYAVRVRFRERGELRSLIGRRVIATLPTTVLRGLDLGPGLSSAKRRAIDEVGMTSVTRSYLQAPARFWGDLGGVDTDLEAQQLMDATGGQAGEAGILESYATGARARELAGLDEAARLARVKADVERVFPGSAAGIERATSWAWDREPYSRGGYAWYRPGQLAAHLGALRAPEGCVFFAGEHTSTSSGWMQGALESGERAAREALASWG